MVNMKQNLTNYSTRLKWYDHIGIEIYNFEINSDDITCLDCLKNYDYRHYRPDRIFISCGYNTFQTYFIKQIERISAHKSKINVLFDYMQEYNICFPNRFKELKDAYDRWKI